MEEKTCSSKKVFNGKIINVRIDEVQIDGKVFTREVVEHPGGVAILALDKDHMIYCVRQFRYGQQKEMLELPAGKLERGENPFETAKRELQEEVGIIAENWIYLGEFIPTGAYLEEKIAMYFASDLKPSVQNLDEDEFIQVEKYTLDELTEMIMNQTIIDGKTMAMVLKVNYMLQMDQLGGEHVE